VSELAKLLENAFLTTGISLVGEVTRLAHAAGVPAREVTEAAATKPHGYFPFHPGPGIGGHCLRNDLDLLRQHAATLGLPTPMLDGIAEVAAGLPDLVVARLERLLAESGRQLRGADVLLVGVGFKAGSPDLTETPAEPIARRLRETGARVAYADAQVPVFAVDRVPLRRVAAELAGERFAAGVVLAGDRTVGIEVLRGACGVVLDAGGGAILGGRFAAGERL
jgi:nucleotide sugar dehydrogenase